MTGARSDSLRTFTQHISYGDVQQADQPGKSLKTTMSFTHYNLTARTCSCERLTVSFESWMLLNNTPRRRPQASRGPM